MIGLTQLRLYYFDISQHKKIFRHEHSIFFISILLTYFIFLWRIPAHVVYLLFLMFPYQIPYLLLYSEQKYKQTRFGLQVIQTPFLKYWTVSVCQSVCRHLYYVEFHRLQDRAVFHNSPGSMLIMTYRDLV